MLLRFLRLTALLCAVACVALGAQLPASAGEGNLVPEHPHWVRLPADTGGQPMVAADSAAGAGYVFSGTAQFLWDRVQAVALPTGRPLSKLVAIPKMEARAPLVVDEKRHLVMYAEALPAPVPGVVQQPTAATIVGISLRGGAVRELFRYQTRLPQTERLAGMSLDDSGDDLLVLSAVDGATYNSGLPVGSPVIHVDRLSIDALVRKAPATRWTSTYSLPAGPCTALMFKNQPAALLVVGNAAFFGCGVPNNGLTTVPPTTSGQQPGLTALTGVTREASPPITATYYPAPGKTAPGETVADRHTRRLVLMASTPEGNVMRVFDTDHRRYVGTIRSPGSAAGATTDPRTSRLYFASTGGYDRRSLGHADLAPLVPAQGETQADPWVAMLGSDVRRLTFDTRSQRLLLPWYDTATSSYSVAMVRDELPRYVPVPDPNPDAGAVDTVDRPGLTDSNRSASARAFGADYQSIGGAANILVNAGGGENALNVSPGSRYLRQAYVKQASLASDGSTAVAVAGEEDSTTDGDRGGVPGAASSFAPPALCSDFGTSPTRQPVIAVTAQVTCDLEKERTRASATYVADDAVFITGTSKGSPVPAPVQVGRSSADVVSQRDPDRGALHTTVTATAENITVLGAVRIGKVTSTVNVSAHGRRGAALANAPKVEVSGVSVGATPVCGASCSLDQVSGALNKALAGRARVEFPRAEVTRSRGGTTARVAQDAWYHAERILDYDKSDDDFAVPAMTIIAYLDGQTKSRLVVDLAGVTASASYRTYRLDRFTGGAPAALASGGALTSPPVGAPSAGGLLSPVGAPAGEAPAAAEPTAQQGFLAGVSDALHLALRSPRAAIPLLFIWALLGLPEYLAARRRLLLELPMLTRETDVA